MTRSHEEASKIHGPKFEQRVLAMLRSSGKFSMVRAATYDEQTRLHFDILAIAHDGKVLKIECKSIKDSQDDLCVIEGRTVCDRKGETHPGWLFGKATHLAHERAGGRITWVPMSSLRAYVTGKNVNWDAVPLSKKIPGHVYTRISGREQDPMIEELVIIAGVEFRHETRGDRMVYFPMKEVENLKGVYTA